MLPQERKYFRFRFSQVLALIFLLTSPTQASSGPKRCAEVVTAWMAADPVSLFQDPKFILNLAVCINEVKEAIPELQKLQNIIQRIPELIKTALTKKEGLVLLSVYVLSKSFELYNRAINLEQDYRMHREEFEALKEEMKPLQDFIVTQLIPEWEKDNTANLQKVTDKLLERMSRQCTVLRELTRAIHRDKKQAGNDIRWSAFYGVVAAAACCVSIPSGNELIILFACGAGAGTVGFTIVTYIRNSDTLVKLDVLGNDAMAMRKEILRYRAQLEVAKMRGELYG